MTTNTTDPGKEKMDCARVAREDFLESYLLGRLSEADRDALEQHYFECTRCFDDLQTLRFVRTELQHGSAELNPETKAIKTSPLVVWAPIGLVSAAILAGILLWVRPALSPPSRDISTPSASSQPQSQQPGPEPKETSGERPPSIELLAQVEPAPYEAGSFRGPLDEATQRFNEGMDAYRKADYAKAVNRLRTARELDPNAAHISFFLGVSDLMVGRDDAAIDALQATIALGESPYLEEAHFYLAKAFLRRKDFDAAAAQLNQVIRRRGSQSGQARQLLTEIERVRR